MSSSPNEAFSGFLLLLARLWRARWLILLFGFVFALVTYVNLKFFTLETFRSDAVLYLSKDIEPPTVKSLITNTEVISVVRTRFRKEFPKARGIGYLDDFMRRFHVSSEIVTDNSVKKDYSPAVTVSADAHTPQEAQGLTRIWIDEVFKRYGGASGGEARFRADHGRILLDQLKKQDQDTVKKRTAADYRVAALESRLKGLIRILSPTDTLNIGQQREFTSYVEGLSPKQQQFSVNVPSNTAPVEPGLIEQRMKLRIESAKARAQLKSYREQISTVSDTDKDLKTDLRGKILNLQANIAGTEAEEKSLSQQIDRVRDDMTSLSLALQKAKADQAAFETDLASLHLQEDYVGSSIASDAADAYMSQQESNWADGSQGRLDFAIVAPPSLPDRKIAPLRLLNAILAAIIGGILTCFVIAFVHLIERLPKLAPSKPK